MAWIQTVDAGEASGKVKEVYEGVSGKEGNVPAIIRSMSLHPEGVEAVANLFRTLMFGESPLTRGQREMIAVRVSTLNECEY